LIARFGRRRVFQILDEAGRRVDPQLWNNVSVKPEYLYVNLGHGNTVNVVAQVGFPPSSFSASYGRN
jgi:hypothetical protein